MFIGLLTGCGFRPLYQETGNVFADGQSRDIGPQLGLIRVAPIQDRSGQLLRNNLLDLLNPAGEPRAPRYVLIADLSESRQNLAVERTAFATRANLRLNTTFQLIDLKNREQVLESENETVSSFNILTSEFATTQNEANARKLGLRQLSFLMRQKIAVELKRYLRDQPS